jgi:hypothetical protein
MTARRVAGTGKLRQSRRVVLLTWLILSTQTRGSAIRLLISVPRLARNHVIVTQISPHVICTESHILQFTIYGERIGTRLWRPRLLSPFDK